MYLLPSLLTVSTQSCQLFAVTVSSTLATPSSLLARGSLSVSSWDCE
jgi:hypothetical protein